LPADAGQLGLATGAAEVIALSTSTYVPLAACRRQLVWFVFKNFAVEKPDICEDSTGVAIVEGLFP
jgi:hypothetical protein